MDRRLFCAMRCNGHISLPVYPYSSFKIPIGIDYPTIYKLAVKLNP